MRAKEIFEVNLIDPLDDVSAESSLKQDFNFNMSGGPGVVRGHIRDLEIRQGTNPWELFLINEEGKPVGSICLAQYQGPIPNMHRVSYVWLHPSLRGKGYGYSLYAFFLDRGFVLVSDYDQTVFSRSIWQRLARSAEYAVHELQIGAGLSRARRTTASVYKQPDKVLVAKKR